MWVKFYKNIETYKVVKVFYVFHILPLKSVLYLRDNKKIHTHTHTHIYIYMFKHIILSFTKIFLSLQI